MLVFFWGFPGGLDDKESACNEGDLGLIPGSGRSPGEGNGNPLQYSCLENPMDGGAWQATVHGVAELDTTEWLHFSFWLTLWLHRVLSLVTIMNRGAFSRGSTSLWCWCNWFCGGLVTDSVSHNEHTCLWGRLSSQSSRTLLKHWYF